MNVEEHCLNSSEIGKSQILDILRFRNTALKTCCKPILTEKGAASCEISPQQKKQSG
jgi:hypothetical protein